MKFLLIVIPMVFILIVMIINDFLCGRFDMMLYILDFATQIANLVLNPFNSMKQTLILMKIYSKNSINIITGTSNQLTSQPINFIHIPYHFLLLL